MTRAGLLAACAISILSCGACGGDEGAGTSDHGRASATHVLVEARRGPVGVVVKTDTPEPRFGDRVLLEITIDAEPRVTVQPLDFPGRMGHLLRAGRKDPPSKAGGPTVYGLLVQPERTGLNIAKLPEIVFEIGEGEGAGTVEVLPIPSFELTVAGLSSEERPALADVGDPLPPVPLPERDRGMLTLWVAIGGATVLLALTGLVWWQRRRTDAWTPPPVDPVEEARRAFDALLRRGLIDRGEYGEFYVGLTGIVCKFIERTTGIHAQEETTEEFLRDVEHHEAFPVERRRGLQRFMESADLVKYAAQVPDRDDVREAVDAAFAFCKIDTRPGVPGPSPAETA